jgi:ubiquinone/menaquinone biosynthesis C-methylase UbiE
MIFYVNYDSSSYWRKRASEPDQAAVMWKNQEYNDLYRILQRQIIEPYVSSLASGSKVLDIGCGIGVVSEMILSINPNVIIDAVDFEEMIQVASARVSEKKVHFISSSAEAYKIQDETYNLIISSGCYSTIRNINELEKSLMNGCKMLKKDAIMLLIDPFHRWNYLARAKYGSRQVTEYVGRHYLKLQSKSGVLFWPFREWLANSDIVGPKMKFRFMLGERILHIMGQHFWADYKVLIFKKVDYS